MYFFFRFALKIFIRKLNIFDNFLVGFEPITWHSECATAYFGTINLICYNLVLKCSFILCMILKYPLKSWLKHPRSLKMETIVISQQFDFIVELAMFIVSLHEFLWVIELNVIFQYYPWRMMILLHKLLDLYCEVGIVWISRVDWKGWDWSFKIC